MKVNTKNVKFFQAGGAAPAGDQGGAPDQGAAPQGGSPDQGGQAGQDPLQQIVQMFVQGLQNQDCAALAQGAQAFIQMVQQSQGGAQGSEAGGAPVAGQSEQPVYAKKGTKLVMTKKVAKPNPFDKFKNKQTEKGEPDGDEAQNAKKGAKIKK